MAGRKMNVGSLDDARAVVQSLKARDRKVLEKFFQSKSDSELAYGLYQYSRERGEAGAPITVGALAHEISQRGVRYIDGVPYLRNNPERKVIAISKDRYKASAEERRRYGGNTVTEFYVMYADDEKDASKWKKIFGMGKTPGERKTYAIEKFKAMQTTSNPRKGKKRNPYSSLKIDFDSPEAKQLYIELTVGDVKFDEELFIPETGEGAWLFRDTRRILALDIDPETRFATVYRLPYDSDRALERAWQEEVDDFARHGVKPRRRSNPGKRHMACGKLPKKRCDQLNDIYESSRDRGYSKKRSAQIARGTVRKQVAKDKRKKNPGRPRAAYKAPRVWLEATSGQGETRALVIQDGEIMEVIAIRDPESDASWAKARRVAEKIAMQYAKDAGQKSRPKWEISRRGNPRGGGVVSDQDVDALILWIDNTEQLYRQWQTIVKNLWKFKHKGTYDHDRAIDGFMHLADAAAKSYNREIERSKASGYGRFSVATRRAVAKDFADSFEDNDRDEKSYDPRGSKSNPRNLRVEKHGTHGTWYVRDADDGSLMGSPKGHKTKKAALAEKKKIETRGSSRYLKNPARRRRNNPEDPDRSNASAQIKMIAARLAAGG